MAVRYSGHMVQTRQQGAWLSVLILAVLLPLAVWRSAGLPVSARIALVALTLAPIATAYQTWRFLEVQEQQHAEPTAGMAFAFRFLASTPLATGALWLILLMAMNS